MSSKDRLVMRRCFAATMAIALTSTAYASSKAAAQASALRQSVDIAMRGRGGAAVVVEVNSAHVLAAYHLEVAARRLARPGSAIKTFTLLAMLRSGVLQRDTALACQRRVRLAGRQMDCSHVRLAQDLQPAAALSYSCNYYFAHFAAQLRDPALTQVLVSAGFTSPTGLVEGEAVGKVEPSRSLEDLQLKALGESDIEVTPLELLMAYRGLASREKEAQDPVVQIVLEGLRGATEFGTAQLARVSGLTVAGKTGTAKADEGRWTHGWFVGFAPATDPQIALVVFLERGNGPGDASAIAGSILSSYARQRSQK